MTGNRVILSLAVLLFAAGGLWLACSESGVTAPAAPAAPPDKGWTATEAETSNPGITLDSSSSERTTTAHRAASTVQTPNPTQISRGKKDAWQAAARTRVALALLREHFANLSPEQKIETLNRIEGRTRDRIGEDYRVKARDAILSDAFPMFEDGDTSEMRKYKQDIEKQLRAVSPRLGISGRQFANDLSTQEGRSALSSMVHPLLLSGPIYYASSAPVAPLSCNDSIRQHCNDIAAAQAEAAYHLVYFWCWLGTWGDGLNHHDCDDQAREEMEHEYAFVRDECLEGHGC